MPYQTLASVGAAKDASEARQHGLKFYFHNHPEDFALEVRRRRHDD